MKHFLAILFSITLICVGCSKNDDSDYNKTNIVGKWLDTYDMESSQYYFIFNSDGTFSTEGDGGIYTGEYSISNNRVDIIMDNYTSSKNPYQYRWVFNIVDLENENLILYELDFDLSDEDDNSSSLINIESVSSNDIDLDDCDIFIKVDNL